jgi:thioredoxin 1
MDHIIGQTPSGDGAALPKDMIVDGDQKTFMADVIEASRTKPVLVDFWATWCGPCRQMTPIIDQLAEEYQGKAKIGKLNVDEQGQTAMRYQVRGIPTLLLFKGGQLVATKVGATGKGDVQKMIDEHLT